MDFVFYSFATWIILLLIGLPIAAIVLPKGLKDQSLVLAPLVGYGLLTFISYYFYRSNIGGTDIYAWFLAIPSLLVVAGYSTRLFPRPLGLAELFNADSLAALGFTTVSWVTLSWLYFDLGSPAIALAISNLDVAELAVVSRYLKEFPRDTTIGFMGQTGWLKHTGDVIWFAPSAIVAVISTFLKTEPYKLQTLVMNVLGAQGVGIFFLFVRQLPGMNRPLAGATALLYALSPTIVYTAWQSFGAQTISIPIIIAIFYIYFHSLKTVTTWRQSVAVLASLSLLFSTLLVTYHFMAVIVFGLIGFHSIVLSVIENSQRRFFYQSTFLILLLVVVIAVNPFRVAAIFETQAMLLSNNGWFIRWINPSAQLGFNAGEIFLGGYSFVSNFLSYLLICGFLGLILWHLTRRSEDRSTHLAFYVGLFLPIFLLGTYFAIVERQDGVLGSYRSFKITATFVALSVIAGALPLTNRFFQDSSRRKLISFCCIGLLCLSSLISLWQIVVRHRKDVYLLPQSVIELSRIEAMDKVSGLNILDMGNFTNLWANYFLLKKPHVFQQFPYGGRVVGPLGQPYTLIADLERLGLNSAGKRIFVVKNLNMIDHIPVNSTFTIREAASSGGLTLTTGAGWWDAEPTHQWSGRDGRTVEVMLDVQAPLALKLSGEYAELRSGDSLRFYLDGTSIPVSTSSTGFRSNILVITKGRHIVKITSLLDTTGPTAWDGRTLGILWKSFIAEQVELP